MDKAPLSVVASRIYDLWKRLDFFYADPITVAYGAADECGPLVVESTRIKVEQLLAVHGWDAEAFDDELRRRTTDKWAFNFGSVHDFLVGY